MHIGFIEQIVRYPVKSMAGVPTNSATLGWHGIQGDRRYAFRRVNDNSDFPWLSASKLPELLLYYPIGLDENAEDPLPSHVRTPEGDILPIESNELENRIKDKYGDAVELMKLKHGIFDDSDISVITRSTITAVCEAAELTLDSRRFRANIVIASDGLEAFAEDTWVGGKLVFGDIDSGPALHITLRDVRCMMINLDPDTAKQNADMMKAVVRLNNNTAGVYASVLRTGEVSVGQPVTFIREESVSLG